MSTFYQLKRLKVSKFPNNQLHTQFENLSNDVILEILEYLDEKHIYDAFYGLNQRFSQFIHNYPSRSVSLAFNNEDSSKMEQYCHKLIVPNVYRIRQLKFNCSDLIQTVLLECKFNESFSRLETISFYENNLQTLTTLTSQLSTLPQLKKLTIKFYRLMSQNTVLNEIYSSVLQCSTLISLTIEDRSRNITTESFQYFSNNVKQTNIEIFQCLHQVELISLQSLLENMPKLRYLETSQSEICSANTTHSFVAPKFHQLTSLFIDDRSSNLYSSRNIVAGLGFSIRCLKLRLSLLIFIRDAPVWNELLCNNLAQLNVLKLELGHDGSGLFRAWYSFHPFLINLLKSSKWNEEPWEIVYDACALRLDKVLMEFKRKRMLTSTISQFTLKVSELDSDKNLCCELCDIFKSSIRFPKQCSHITVGGFELYHIPFIVSVPVNLQTIIIDNIDGSPSYYLDTVAQRSFTHKNVNELKINCTLCPKVISILLKWFPSFQRLELQLDDLEGEQERQEIILIVIEFIRKKVRLQVVFFLRKERTKTVEWMREKINSRNNFDEKEASQMYSITKKRRSIVLTL